MSDDESPDSRPPEYREVWQALQDVERAVDEANAVLGEHGLDAAAGALEGSAVAAMRIRREIEPDDLDLDE